MEIIKMISAKEARDLIDDENVYTAKLLSLDSDIRSSAAMGYTTASIYVGIVSIRDRIVNHLQDLGYKVSIDDSEITVSF